MWWVKFLKPLLKSKSLYFDVKTRIRIISRAVVRQFSADGDSHKAKHLRLHVCNSHRKPALRLLKRRDGTHHVDDVGVSPGVPAGVPPGVPPGVPLLIQTRGQFIIIWMPL